MKKLLIAVIGAAALLGLVACGEKASASKTKSLVEMSTFPENRIGYHWGIYESQSVTLLNGATCTLEWGSEVYLYETQRKSSSDVDAHLGYGYGGRSLYLRRGSTADVKDAQAQLALKKGECRAGSLFSKPVTWLEKTIQTDHDVERCKHDPLCD